MKKVLILSGFGINSENETKYAFQKAHSDPQIVHINEVIKNHNILDSYDIIVSPGGFSFGDHLGAGFALASLIKVTILDKIKQIVSEGKIILGICNGCQILVKLGFFNYNEKKITITENKNKVGYRCIWKDCESTGTRHFDKINKIKLPVAHGEGCFIDLDKERNKNPKEKKEMLEANNMVNENCRIILKYSEGHNHNGSDYNIAGICNKEGNVIAIMPHPERAICFNENNKNFSNSQKSTRIVEENKLEFPITSIYTRFFYNLVSKSDFC